MTTKERTEMDAACRLIAKFALGRYCECINDKKLTPAHREAFIDDIADDLYRAAEGNASINFNKHTFWDNLEVLVGDSDPDDIFFSLRSDEELAEIAKDELEEEEEEEVSPA